MNGKVIAIINQKGGCGKTTSTLNLAMELALLGKKVLMIDADPENNLTKWCIPKGVSKSLSNALAKETIGTRLEPLNVNDVLINYRPNLDLIPSNSDLSGNEIELQIVFDKERVMQKVVDKANLREKYDYILVDCPPNLGSITINTLTASDELIIPVDGVFAAQNMGALFSLVAIIQQTTNRNLSVNGIFFTLTEKTNITKEVHEAVKKKYRENIYIYETEIHKGVKAEESVAAALPLVEHAKAAKVSLDYAEFAKEFLRRDEQ